MDQTNYEEKINMMIEEIRTHGLVVFCGAGISVAKPCCNPTFNGLKKYIIETFINKLINKNWPITDKLIERKNQFINMDIRPETFLWILDNYIDHDITTSIINSLDAGSPNMNHKIIKLLSQEHIIKAIITPNFDTYIEKELLNETIDYYVIRDYHEITQNDNSLLILKPHGCLSKPDSLKFRIDNIQSLNYSLEAVLSKLLMSAPVLIAGYSGFDEDILPIIQKSLSSSIYSSIIVIYPGSPSNEPIQLWNIDELKTSRVYANTTDVLKYLFLRLGKNTGNINAISDYTDNNWQEVIYRHVNKLPNDIIALVLSHMAHVSGNNEDTLFMAELAEDICDSDYKDIPKNSLIRSILLQNKAYIELGDFKTGLMILRCYDYLIEEYDSIFFEDIFGKVYGYLRSNNLDMANKTLLMLGALFNKYIDTFNEPTGDEPYSLLAFIWYSAILNRKLKKEELSQTLFEIALPIAYKKNDILHLARILLDYGILYCHLKDWDNILKCWELSIIYSLQVNDWLTAAKANKNLGVLMSFYDDMNYVTPYIIKSIELFKKAGDSNGVKKAEDILGLNLYDIKLLANQFVIM